MKRSLKLQWFLPVLLCLFIGFADAQDGVPYRIYNNKGKDISFEKFISEAKGAEVVLFGEFHDNSMLHWLQLQTLKSLAGEWGKEMGVGAEMFERDDQLIIEEYLDGFIQLKHLEKEAKLWPNFKTDYLPLLSYCEENGLAFFASNVPRRYAALVAREGLDTLKNLSENARSYIAPLPISIDTTDVGYKEMMHMDMGHGMGNMKKQFVQAQALKDATMAWSIVGALNNQAHVLHFNGDFHSRNQSGIYRFIKQYRPQTEVFTIAVAEGDPTEFKDSYKSLADVIIVVPADMTKTH